MNSAGRLGVFAAGLALAFGASYATASALAPPEAAQRWQQSSADTSHGEDIDHAMNP